MRRRKAEKRDVQPDPIFEDKLITRFVNNLMKDGKKNVARKIVYQAFELIEERTSETGLEIFRSASNSTPVVSKITPCWWSNLWVPVEVRQERGTALGMRWLIRAAFSK